MKNINITVIAGSWAKRFINEETVRLSLKDYANISDALVALGIPLNEIGLTAIDGKAVPRETKLRDGDRIRIFPVIVEG